MSTGILTVEVKQCRDSADQLLDADRIKELESILQPAVEEPLYIVSEIIQASGGGTLRVTRPAVDKHASRGGTKFSFTMPFKQQRMPKASTGIDLNDMED